MVKPGYVETSSQSPDVADKDTEGICVPFKCEHAPSSWGTGRSEGKAVSVLVSTQSSEYLCH
jgi:hypothetical protein